MTNGIDNSNLINMCRDCGAVGFVPALAYVYDAVAKTVTITNTSTIPAGDTLAKVKVKVHDFFSQQAVGLISVGSGGEGYETPPTVVFSGGGGTGAAGTAVLTNGRVTGVTITAPGSGYTTDPTVTFTGGGGVGAAGTVVRSSQTVASVTLTADDNTVVISTASLNASKPLAICATVITTGGIIADGGAYGILSAGNLSYWDVQKSVAV